MGTEAVTAALELGRRLGARTVLNAAPAPPPGSLDLNALLPATDVLVVNETEAELMAGGERGEEVGWAGPAARLLGLGCRSVVITLGAAGAVVAQADRPGIVAVPAPQVRDLVFLSMLRIRIANCRIRMVCFWASWIRIRSYEVWIWIRILLSSSKNSQKNPLLPTVL